MREDILLEAENLINGDRRDLYGSAQESFGRIGLLWSAYVGSEITDTDVANMMVLLKVSRAKSNPRHGDSYVDMAGYAALSAELAEEDV